MDTTKVMYGENAIHVPMWMVVQNGPPAHLICGATKSPKIMYGTKLTHVLILGEMVIRPHFAVASDNFVGHGAGGFWTDNPSAVSWLTDGEVLVDTAMGREAIMRWR